MKPKTQTIPLLLAEYKVIQDMHLFQYNPSINFNTILHEGISHFAGERHLHLIVNVPSKTFSRGSVVYVISHCQFTQIPVLRYSKIRYMKKLPYNGA